MNNTAKILTYPEKSNEAKQFLNNPNLTEEIISDLGKLGYIGEKNNKLLAYLIATSRKMEHPLAGIILSRSSAGKSKLMSTVMKLIPNEDIINITSATKEAFYYVNDLNHKLVCLGESSGLNKNLEYQIRELLSAHEIQKMVPAYNNRIIESSIKKVKGKIAFLMSSTSTKLNPENLSRCIILYVNESKEQTEDILKYQRYLHTIEGLKEKVDIDSIIKKHHQAQKLLENIKVCIPYAEYIKFPSHRINSRRDQMKLLNLITAITFLHQFQREKKYIKINNKQIEYIESTLNDYQIAYNLFTQGILQNTMSDLPKVSRDLHKSIVKLVNTKAKKEDLIVLDVPFTCKEIMNNSDFTFVQVRNYIKILEEHEVVEVLPDLSHKKKKVYKLVESNLYDLKINIIPTPDQISNLMNEQQ